VVKDMSDSIILRGLDHFGGATADHDGRSIGSPRNARQLGCTTVISARS
jgi:hypothetical protein